MATGRESRYLWQCNVAQVLKAALLVVGITVLGYLGVEIARQAGPLLNAASGYALESRMLNPEALIESREGQSVEGDAMAAALAPLSPTVPVREFEYFPEHYVNGATKIDDQPPTF